jgi:murein L,D-transpeptidase YafK
MRYAKASPGASRPPRPAYRRHAARGILMASLLIVASVLPATAGAVSSGFEIEIDKTARRLVVRAGQEVLRTFHVAVGRGGRGDKVMRGDKKTPIGTYRVLGQNASTRFETFVPLNYPNVKDAYYGLRNAVISRTEFDDIVTALREGRTPPQDTALGGAIGIHGIGEETPEKIRIHDNLDWTEGCIALRNAELRELRRFLTVGTRVVIRE